MNELQQSISRRRWIELLVAGGAGLGSGGFHEKFSQTLLPVTPNTVLGPFFPMKKPLDQDADLTHVRGRKGQAAGQVIELSGRVITRDGGPVRNARIELWQANSFGRYDHASDPNTKARLDPNFQGYAVQFTDGEGRYQFRTIKPGPYPSETGEYIRSPHIHFDVTGRTDRKVTQMYFPNDPLLGQDKVYQSVLRNKEALFGEVRPPVGSSGVLMVTWDIVLRTG